MNIRQYLNIKDETFSITSNYLFIYGNKDNSTIINLQSKQKYINHNVMDPDMPLAKIFNIIIPNQTYEHILSLNNKVIYKEWFKKDFEPTELNFTTINDKRQYDRSRKINVDTNLKPYGSSKPTWINLNHREYNRPFVEDFLAETLLNELNHMTNPCAEIPLQNPESDNGLFLWGNYTAMPMTRPAGIDLFHNGLLSNLINDNG